MLRLSFQLHYELMANWETFSKTLTSLFIAHGDAQVGGCAQSAKLEKMEDRR